MKSEGPSVRSTSLRMDFIGDKPRQSVIDGICGKIERTKKETGSLRLIIATESRLARHFDNTTIVEPRFHVFLLIS